MGIPVEVQFEDGKLKRINKKRWRIVLDFAWRLAIHAVIMLAALSFGKATDYKPFLDEPPAALPRFGLPWSIPALYLHTVWVYCMLALPMLNHRMITAALWGLDTQVTMRAPLSQSTSIRDFWGRRWNLIIHGLMKRCFFMPFQNAGPGRARERRDRQQRMALALFTVGVRPQTFSGPMRKNLAGLLSFAMSGLFHEYMWLTLHVARPESSRYVAGKVLSFFLVQYLSTAFEVLLGKTRLGQLAAPAVLRTVLTTLCILPFGPLFLEEPSGMSGAWDITGGSRRSAAAGAVPGALPPGLRLERWPVPLRNVSHLAAVALRADLLAVVDAARPSEIWVQELLPNKAFSEVLSCSWLLRRLRRRMNDGGYSGAPSSLDALFKGKAKKKVKTHGSIGAASRAEIFGPLGPPVNFNAPPWKTPVVTKGPAMALRPAGGSAFTAPTSSTEGWARELKKDRTVLCGLRVKEVEGDGACLFRAFADQLTADEPDAHARMREECVDFMVQHRGDFEPFIDEPWQRLGKVLAPCPGLDEWWGSPEGGHPEDLRMPVAEAWHRALSNSKGSQTDDLETETRGREPQATARTGPRARSLTLTASTLLEDGRRNRDKAESVSPARMKWRRVRRLYDGGMVMQGLLNDVRSRQTEGIYSLDWSNVPSTSTSSHRIFTKELSDAEASVHTRPSTKDDTEKVYAADWTEVPGHPSPAAIENWKRLKLASEARQALHGVNQEEMEEKHWNQQSEGSLPKLCLVCVWLNLDAATEDEFESYCSRMRQRCTWGGHVEVQALARRNGVNAIIYQPSQASGRPDQILRSAVEIQATDEHAGCVQLSFHPTHHAGQHYNSVRCCTDDGVGPAELVSFGHLAEVTPTWKLGAAKDDRPFFDKAMTRPGSSSPHVSGALPAGTLLAALHRQASYAPSCAPVMRPANLSGPPGREALRWRRAAGDGHACAPASAEAVGALRLLRGKTSSLLFEKTAAAFADGDPAARDLLRQISRAHASNSSELILLRQPQERLEIGSGPTSLLCDVISLESTTGRLQYCWHKDGQPIPRACLPRLVLSGGTADAEGIYTCRVRLSAAARQQLSQRAEQRQRYESPLRRAAGALQLGDVPRAVQLLSEAIHAAIDDEAVRAEAFCQRSELRVRLAHWQAAFQDAVEALKLQPSLARAHAARGAAAEALGFLAEAVSSWEAAELLGGVPEAASRAEACRVKLQQFFMEQQAKRSSAGRNGWQGRYAGGSAGSYFGGSQEGERGSSCGLSKGLQESLQVLGFASHELPSAETLRSAYRKLALAMHPDKPGGSITAFQERSNAYEAVLKALRTPTVLPSPPMPVPWSTQRRRSFIRNVADRGLRVRQLWDLTIFLKRLCKTRSLLNSKHAEECGPIKWLDWQALNLYNITDEVIKKYIPYHDRQWEVNEEDPERAAGSRGKLSPTEPQELQLYTSNGQVGSSAVSSGPLVDAISRWDVRKSEAAEQAYKRQILNFIADDDDHRPLLHSHGEAFETLNMDIRVSVLGRIGQKRKATGCKIPWVGHRGITLGQLRTFARKAQRKLAKEQPEACFQEVTVEQICRWIVQPETSQRKCSYAELVADAPQIPDGEGSKPGFSFFTNSDVYMACSSGVMACTKLFPDGHSKFGVMDRQVTEAIYHVDVKQAAARASEKIAKDVLSFINNESGSCGEGKLKLRLQRWAAFHLVPFCCASPGCLKDTTLHELISLPGFSIHSDLAKGSLGQSCLHEAVAVDSIELARKLLAHCCQPNSADNMQETPLHYAALRGNAEMVRLLLQVRADIHMESRYGETAFDVARQKEWFQLMPHLLSSEGWAVALARPKAKLCHRTCPWGGHLIRFNLKGITIQNAPAKTSHVLVRHQVRALFQKECPMSGNKLDGHEFVRPGEAILTTSTSWKLMRLCTVLFGDVAGQFIGYFFHNKDHPARLHHKIRRDYPLEGDSASAIWDHEQSSQGAVLVVRPDGDAFNITVVARVPEDKFASWATFQFRILLESTRQTVQYFLNRPGICELRARDACFYMVLSIQSFKRGMPLVPCGEPIITIDAGERLGMKHWARFQPGSYGSTKFRLSHPPKDWMAVKDRFFEVFPLAKTAYRRANGGPSAPGVHEDVDAKFLSDDPSESREPRLIVRNTFLDIEDEEELQRKAECQVRNARRPKTTLVYPIAVCVERPGFQPVFPKAPGCSAPRAEDFQRLRSEIDQLQKELEHQFGLRRVLQANLDSERNRSADLTKTNAELLRASEERLQGQRRLSDVETSELAEQVDALLLLKRQLYQRIQSLEQERSSLLSQREEAVSDRSCVACLDRLANTVLLRWHSFLAAATARECFIFQAVPGSEALVLDIEVLAPGLPCLSFDELRGRCFEEFDRYLTHNARLRSGSLLAIAGAGLANVSVFQCLEGSSFATAVVPEDDGPVVQACCFLRATFAYVLAVIQATSLFLYDLRKASDRGADDLLGCPFTTISAHAGQEDLLLLGGMGMVRIIQVRSGLKSAALAELALGTDDLPLWLRNEPGGPPRATSQSQSNQDTRPSDHGVLALAAAACKVPGPAGLGLHGTTALVVSSDKLFAVCGHEQKAERLCDLPALGAAAACVEEGAAILMACCYAFDAGGELLRLSWPMEMQITDRDQEPPESTSQMHADGMARAWQPAGVSLEMVVTGLGAVLFPPCWMGHRPGWRPHRQSFAAHAIPRLKVSSSAETAKPAWTMARLSELCREQGCSSVLKSHGVAVMPGAFEGEMLEGLLDAFLGMEVEMLHDMRFGDLREPFRFLPLLGVEECLRDVLTDYLGEDFELESAMVVQVDGGAGRQNAHLDTEDAGSVSVHVPLQPLHEGFAPLSFLVSFYYEQLRPLLTGITNAETPSTSQKAADAVAEEVVELLDPLFLAMVEAVKLFGQDDGSCNPSASMTHSEWHAFFMTLAQQEILTKTTMQYFTQVGLKVDVKSSQVEITVRLSQASGNLRNLIEGNKVKGIPAPPSQMLG
eukprot:g2144.t1